MKKYTVTLEFESKEDAEQWISWYSNSGEQDSYYSIDNKNSTDKNLILNGIEERCPSCKSIGVMKAETFKDKWKSLENHHKVKDPSKWICEDCYHEFEFDGEERNY